MAINNVNVQLELSSGKVGKCAFQIRDIAKDERLRLGLKNWVLAWIAAIASVFLPIAHFFLVPSLLLAGPILFYIKLNREQELLEGEIDCLECSAKIAYKKQSVKWPMEITCPSCRHINSASLLP